MTYKNVKILIFLFWMLSLPILTEFAAGADKKGLKTDINYYECMIIQQYNDFLKRDPLQEEIDFYKTKFISNEVAPEKMINNILNSDEFGERAGFILRIMIILSNNSEYGISPDKFIIPKFKDIQKKIKMLNAENETKTSRKDILKSIVRSSSDSLDPKNLFFLQILYLNASGDNLVPEEAKKISGKINEDSEYFYEWLLSVIDSQKSKDFLSEYLFVTSSYVFLMGRTPSNSEIKYYLELITKSKQPHESVIHSFINSPEYISKIEQNGCNFFIVENFIVTLPENVKIEFVRIPQGTYKMGCDDPEWTDSYQKPAHDANINEAFYISKYEITNDQWNTIMNHKNYNSTDPDKDKPVTDVSWDDCMNYINIINKLKQGEFDLPSESEWEYVCRAGTNTVFPFDNNDCKITGCEPCTLDEYAWWCSNSSDFGKHKVGLKKPNTFGIYDMLGNVYEWCNDDWKDSPQKQKTLPEKNTNAYKVIRGGYWYSSAKHCTSAARAKYIRDMKSDHIGFRIVRRIR